MRAVRILVSSSASVVKSNEQERTISPFVLKVISTPSCSSEVPYVSVISLVVLNSPVENEKRT